MPRRKETRESSVFQGVDPVGDLRSKIRDLEKDLKRTFDSSTKSGKLLGNQFKNLKTLIEDATEVTKQHVRHENALERVFGRINEELKQIDNSLDGVNRNAFFSDGVGQAQALADHLDKARLASASMDFQNSSRNLRGMVSNAFGLHRVTSAIQLDAFSEDYDLFAQERKNMLEEIETLNQTLSDSTLSDDDRQKHETLLNYLQDRLDMSEAITGAQMAFRAGVILTLGPLREAAELQQSIQQRLRMTNVGHAESLRLTRVALDAQISSLGLLDQTQAVDIIENLTRRARQFTEDGSDAARTAGELAAGMDFASSASATLLWRFRALGVEDWDDAFKEAADEIAWFGKNTNLTVQEIEGLIEATQPLMYAIPHRLRHNLIPEILGIGAAFKEIGLDASGFIGQLRDMTGLMEQQGVIRAALTTAGGDLDFMDIIRGHASQVQITRDLSHQIREMFGDLDLGITGAQIASQKFGISLDQAIRILEMGGEEFEDWTRMMESEAQQGDARRALEQQIEAPMQAFRSLGNQLNAILVRGASDLLTLLRPFTFLIEKFAQFTNWVSESDVMLRLFSGGIQAFGVYLLSVGIPTFSRMAGVTWRTIGNVASLAMNMDSLTLSMTRAAQASAAAAAAERGLAVSRGIGAASGTAAGAGAAAGGAGLLGRMFGGVRGAVGRVGGGLAARIGAAMGANMVPVLGQLVSIGLILWTLVDVVRMLFSPAKDFLAGIWESTKDLLSIRRSEYDEEQRAGRANLFRRMLGNLEKAEEKKAERDLALISIAQSIGDSGDETAQAVAHLIEVNELRRLAGEDYLPDLAAQLTSELAFPTRGDETHVPTAREIRDGSVVGATGRVIVDNLDEWGWSDNEEERIEYLGRMMEKLSDTITESVDSDASRFHDFQDLIQGFHETEVQQWEGDSGGTGLAMIERFFRRRGQESPQEKARGDRMRASEAFEDDQTLESAREFQKQLYKELQILQASSKYDWENRTSWLRKKVEGPSDIFGEGHRKRYDTQALEIMEQLGELSSLFEHHDPRRTRSRVAEEGLRYTDPNPLSIHTDSNPESPTGQIEEAFKNFLYELGKNPENFIESVGESHEFKPENRLEDFIWRPGESPVSIDSEDTLVGARPTGPIDNASSEKLSEAFLPIAVELQNMVRVIESGTGLGLPFDTPDYEPEDSSSFSLREEERNRLTRDLIREIKHSLNDNPLMGNRKASEGIAAAAVAASRY